MSTVYFNKVYMYAHHVFLTSGFQTGDMFLSIKKNQVRGEITKVPTDILLLWHLHIQAAWHINIHAGTVQISGESDSSLGDPAFFYCPPHWREVTWDSLLESDSCLLPGTFQRAALPEVPTGSEDLHCTSVYQGKQSCSADGTCTMQTTQQGAWRDGHTYRSVTVKVSEALLDVVLWQPLRSDWGSFPVSVVHGHKISSVWCNGFRAFISCCI